MEHSFRKRDFLFKRLDSFARGWIPFLKIGTTLSQRAIAQSQKVVAERFT